ncbi:anti-sigma K factor RskA [Amylibacter marinus]|uniref:Regulator of SigK n=2 Tax=Amylibacter marinus TaxID=1475483 RepID=A0ABQ5VY81_9RHOB|nr:anti-sigma K factor RskA [Amylibacter marinus]
MSVADKNDPDDNALAAEYALHLLSAQDRAAFETRMREDAGLRKLVRDWDHHFHPLSDDFAPTTPPARLKASIDAALFAETTKPNTFSALWRWVLGGGAMAAIAGLFIVLTLFNDPLSITPTHSTSISTADQSIIITAEFSADQGVFVVRRQQGAPAAGRDHEMWLIPEGAPVPISLGVIPDTAEARIEIPQDLRHRLTAAVFAISDEPLGGSPTGQATGPVLAAGPIEML